MDNLIKDYNFLHFNLGDVSNEEIIKFFSCYKKRYIHFFEDEKYIGSLSKDIFLKNKCIFKKDLLFDCSYLGTPNLSDFNFHEMFSLKENCLYRIADKYDMTFESQVKLESYRMFDVYTNEINEFIKSQKYLNIGLLIPDNEKEILGKRCGFSELDEFDVVIDAFLDNDLSEFKFKRNIKVVSANDFLFCALFYSIKDLGFRNSIFLFDVPYIERKKLKKDECDHIFKNQSLSYLFNDLTYLKKCYFGYKNDLEMVKTLKKDLITNIKVSVSDNVHICPCALNDGFDNLVSTNSLFCRNKLFLYGPCTVYSLFTTEVNSLGTKIQQIVGEKMRVINRGIPDGKNLANDIILLLNDEHISGDISFIINKFSDWVKKIIGKIGVLIHSTTKIFENKHYCFLNDFTHITPKGNAILAREISKFIPQNISFENRKNKSILFYKNYFIFIKNKMYCLPSFLFRVFAGFIIRANFEFKNIAKENRTYWVSSGLPHILNVTMHHSMCCLRFFEQLINLSENDLDSLAFSLMATLNSDFNIGLTLNFFDPVFLENMLVVDLPYIKNIKLEKRYIDDLRFYSKENKNGTDIAGSNYYLFLKTNIDKICYSRSNLIGETQKNRFDKLKSSIKKDGYKSYSAIIYNNSPIVRDGSHRAALIYDLFGNVMVSVVNILFSQNHYSYAPMLNEYRSNSYFSPIFSWCVNSRWINFYSSKTKIIRSDYCKNIILNKNNNILLIREKYSKTKYKNVYVLTPKLKLQNSIDDRLHFLETCVGDASFFNKAFSFILKSNKQVIIMCKDGILYTGLLSLLIQLLIKCPLNQIVEDFALSDLIYNHQYINNKFSIDYENSKKIIFRFVNSFLEKYNTIENWFRFIGFNDKMLLELKEKILGKKLLEEYK